MPSICPGNGNRKCIFNRKKAGLQAQKGSKRTHCTFCNLGLLGAALQSNAGRKTVQAASKHFSTFHRPAYLDIVASLSSLGLEVSSYVQDEVAQTDPYGGNLEADEASQSSSIVSDQAIFDALSQFGSEFGDASEDALSQLGSGQGQPSAHELDAVDYGVSVAAHLQHVWPIEQLRPFIRANYIVWQQLQWTTLTTSTALHAHLQKVPKAIWDHHFNATHLSPHRFPSGATSMLATLHLLCMNMYENCLGLDCRIAFQQRLEERGFDV